MNPPPVVALRDVTKSYDKFVAVDRLSFAIGPGTIFGLLGPNGAGKTSTIRMMIGITAPDSGRVELFGEDFQRRHLTRVGFLPEERGLYKRMKVGEHLQYFGELHGLSATESNRRALSWCERLEIAGWMQRKVEELSKGMQQKIQFIGALLHEPDFIILDEPFSGLDPVNATTLKDVMLEMKAAGKTILFSTHRMDQVEKLCDSICLLNRGKAVLQGELKQIKAGYGKNSVLLEYEGDIAPVLSLPIVESFNDYGRYVELKLRSGSDPQDLLQAAITGLRVNRFEVIEPSLDEIFISVVGRDSLEEVAHV